MKSNKKRFTLIELLAVIVILAIIALIAVPIVLNIINTARKRTSLISADNYISALKNLILLKEFDDQTFNGTYYINDLEVEYSDNKFSTGIVNIENNRIMNAKMY